MARGMVNGEALAELIAYDDRRRALQQQWSENPPPDGFVRHDGYYGCGRIVANAGGIAECPCGTTILLVGERS